MILRDIKSYIRQHEMVSDLDIHHKFNVSLDAIHAMVDRLIKHGHILVVAPQSCSTSACGGCNQNEKNHYYYQWSEKKRSPLTIAIEVSKISEQAL